MFDGTSLPPTPFAAGLDHAKTIAEILAIVIGGIWAYYKFFKGRTFNKRLELGVSAIRWKEGNFTLIRAQVQVKNVGLSRFDLRQRGTALRALVQGRSVANNPWKMEWDEEKPLTVDVFEKHEWIEPGETIADQAVLVFPTLPALSVRLEFRMVSQARWRRIHWNAVEIVKPEASSEIAPSSRFEQPIVDQTLERGNSNDGR
jgi:hypothetical protein